MPITTLDDRTALIVVDLQRGVAGIAAAVHPIAEVVARSVALAEAFRERGLPVVLVNVNGRPPGRTDRGPASTAPIPDEYVELMADLDRRPDDIIVTKQTPSAFANTGLNETLRGLGVTQVVVTGVSTSNGAEATARDAHELGYHVTVATDAVTDSSAEAHEYSVANVFPRIAETGTTDDIIAVLAAPRQ
ncbi:isochorismatase family protein [Subtercola sp. YIM 133946]|uniref:isochorismatase family protein n=1 Tax=Subtercola sp. YIM 133946 TaxID=3118909 RepID=UPI002F93D4A7